ncbi:PKD domain-containing protein [Microbulbifer marinus]|uniref:Uncharacterized protein YjiK n=1 Tax=Microbulbifer marinus TaxID=658218 RepID=A0A1H3ZBQ5_9GAMM|nr:PKD domain-containing protein [Microbulbifer marinus]SEA21080.1 Uncharacterized protein YjiK [Microbulbifer marinus]
MGFSKKILIGGCTLLLVACGGGGGGGSSDSGGGASGGATNLAPTADAGSDYSIVASGPIELDGSGSSDGDGKITRYVWKQLSGVQQLKIETAASGVAKATAEPFYVGEQEYVFQIEVTDDDGASDTDTVTVTLLPVAVAPVASAGRDREIAIAERVDLDGSGSSDLNGDISSYSWKQVSGPDVTIEHGDQSVAYFTAPDFDTSVTMELTVTDSAGNTATDSVTYTAVHVAVNLDFPPTDQTVFYGETLDLKGRVQAPSLEQRSLVVVFDGTYINGTITADGTWSAAIPFAGKSAGEYPLRVEVSSADPEDGRVYGADTSVDYHPLLHDFRTAEYKDGKLLALSGGTTEGLRLLEVNAVTGELGVLYEIGNITSQLGSVSYDPVTNTAYFIEVAFNTIFSIDLDSGTLTTVSGDGTGSGPGFSQLVNSNIEVAPDSSVLHVFDSGLQALIEVNVADGSRSVLSQGGTVGAGTGFENAYLSVTDFANGKAYVYDDRSPDYIYRVDLETGDRVVMPNSVGPTMNLAKAMWLDKSNGKLLITGLVIGETDYVIVEVDVETGDKRALPIVSGDVQLLSPIDIFRVAGDSDYTLTDSDSYDAWNAVFQVVPDTGARTQVFRDEVGIGSIPRDLMGLALDFDNRIAYAADYRADGVLAINMDNGDRTFVYGSGVGTGSALNNPSRLAYDKLTKKLYVWSVDGGNIVQIDPETSVGTEFLSGASDPRVANISSMQIDSTAEVLYYSRFNDGAIYKVDLNTKEIAVVSSSTRGEGSLMESVRAISLAPDREKMFAANDSSSDLNSLVAIDIATGDRTVIVDSNNMLVGYSGWFNHLSGVSSDGTIYASFGRRIYSINTSTGEWLMKSGDLSIGDGLDLFNIEGLALDEVRGLLYAANGHYDSLMAVEPESGDRITVSR